jgi:hypothetical protein
MAILAHGLNWNESPPSGASNFLLLLPSAKNSLALLLCLLPNASEFPPNKPHGSLWFLKRSSPLSSNGSPIRSGLGKRGLIPRLCTQPKLHRNTQRTQGAGAQRLAQTSEGQSSERTQKYSQEYAAGLRRDLCRLLATLESRSGRRADQSTQIH